MNQGSHAITFVAPVLHVSDLARSVAYYRHRLGFDLEFEYEGFYASVLRDGCRIHLDCGKPTARDQQAFEAAERLDACFGVADANALAAEVAEAGADISVHLRDMPYGREFYVRDPDGYILGFIQSTGSTRPGPDVAAGGAWPDSHRTFRIGDNVRKVRGSQWHGRVVGWYATELTPEGYAVESDTERGSVQIYPASALERAT